MCQPRTEGGRRCATHTRAVLKGARDDFERKRSTASHDAYKDAMCEHAYTPQGFKEVLALREEAPSDSFDRALAVYAVSAAEQRTQMEADIARQVRWEPLARSADPAHRVAALRGYRRNKTNNLTDDALIRLSTDPSPEVLKAVAAYGGALPDRAIINLAETRDSDVLLALAKSKGFRGSGYAMSFVMRHSTPEVRFALASRSLINADDRRRLDKDPDPRIRAESLYSKSHLSGQTSAKQATQEGFRDPDARVRLAALKAWERDRMSESRDAFDRAEIDRLRTDRSKAVREMATRLYARRTDW